MTTSGYLRISSKKHDGTGHSPHCFAWIPNPQNLLKQHKKNWKRRYFVLQEAADRSGHAAQLIYYKDEKCRQPKGSIDLEHCEEVISTLDSPIYNHLFALRTVQARKNEARTYYLAADSQQHMNAWVDSLCFVLGLKENMDAPEDPPPPQPAPRPAPTLSQSPIPAARVILPPPIQPPPMRGAPPPAGGCVPNDYIPLDNCFSNHPMDDDHLTSVPDTIAPSVPVEYDHPKGSGVDRNDNLYRTPPSPGRPVDAPGIDDLSRPNRGRATDDAEYHSPPSGQPFCTSIQSVYNVPPRCPDKEHDYVNRSADSDDDVYNVPRWGAKQSVYNTPKAVTSNTVPRAGLKREPSERDSNSSTGSKHSQQATDDSGLDSSSDNVSQTLRNLRMNPGQQASRRYDNQDIYNIPPPTCSATVSRTNTLTNDHKLLLNTVPRPGPRAAAMGADNRTQYVNLNDPHPPAPTPQVEYDIPPSVRARATEAALLGVHPPAPVPCSTKVTAHPYVNAGTGVVSVTSAVLVPVSPPTTVTSSLPRPGRPGYMPMNQAAKDDSQDLYLPMQEGDSYIPMDGSGQSYIPMTRDGAYLPMTRGESGKDYLPMDGDRDSTYHVLPPGAHAVPGSDYDNRLARDSVRASTATEGERESIYSCHPTNKPVTSPLAPTRGLDAYVPSASTVAGSTVAAVPPRPPVRPPQDSQYTRDSDIYDYSPSNAPVQPWPNRPQDPLPTSIQRPSFNAERSRSFKRQGTDSRDPAMARDSIYACYPNNQPVTSPLSPGRGYDTPALPLNRGEQDDGSSSDEGSDDELSSSNQSLDSATRPPGKSLDRKPLAPPVHPQTEQVKRALNSTPPTPAKKPGEIQYLDLVLDEHKPIGGAMGSVAAGLASKERSPVFVRPPAAPGSSLQAPASTTEYHDIDFVKTKALSETRKNVESKRKSVDE